MSVLEILRPLAEVGNERVRDAALSLAGTSEALMKANLSRYLFQFYGSEVSVQAMLRTHNLWYGALLGNPEAVREVRERALSPGSGLLLETAIRGDEEDLGRALLSLYRASGQSQGALVDRETALYLVAARDGKAGLPALRELIDAEKARISLEAGIVWEEQFNPDEFCRNDFLYRAVLVFSRLGGDLTPLERDSLVAVGILGDPRKIVPRSAFR
jgi:hypothetical protein